jgi:hypothetical protein
VIASEPRLSGVSERGFTDGGASCEGLWPDALGTTAMTVASAEKTSNSSRWCVRDPDIGVCLPNTCSTSLTGAQGRPFTTGVAETRD